MYCIYTHTHTQKNQLFKPCRKFMRITLADQWLPVLSYQNCVRGWTALRKTARSCRKSYAEREKPERGWNVPSLSSNNR